MAQLGDRNAPIPISGSPRTQSAPADYKDTAIMQPLYPTPQEFERVLEERNILWGRLAAAEREIRRLRAVMGDLGTKLIRGEC